MLENNRNMWSGNIYDSVIKDRRGRGYYVDSLGFGDWELLGESFYYAVRRPSIERVIECYQPHSN